MTVYPHRLVFVAGLPKSGTTWLQNLMLAVPAYRRLACYDPRNLLFEHVLDPALVEHLPVQGNFFIKTHVEARPEGVEALCRFGVPTVIMVRDLRDQCVSRFYHVLNDPAHRHHNYYKNGERAEVFSHCLDIAVHEYAGWIRGWLAELRKNSSLFMLVRYEDLRMDVKGQFSRALEHFDIALAEEQIDAIIAGVSAQARQGADLASRLKSGKSTLRAGRVGDWRKHFSKSDVEYFKSVANDVLVSLGYEHDDQWQV